MMQGRPILKGSTDQSVVIRIIDSTDGTPETGVVFNTSGIDLEYRREGAVSTDITEATLSALSDAHSDGGFLHIGNGYYRLDVPDAAFATGANGVLIHGTVTGMVVIGAYHPLVDYNPYDGVRLGLTALPNAAAEAAGGLYTRGTGAGQINQPSNGLINANVTQFGGTAGTFASGRPEVNASHAAGTAWNSGAIGAATLASDTIAAAKIATGAITAAKFAADAITSTVVADNAITAAKIATNAIDADAIAADAVTEIQSGLATQASVNTIDDFLDTEMAAVLAAVDTEVAAILALLDDARGEPGQGNPPVNPDAMTKIDYLYKAWRNRSTQTATEYALYADDGVTKDHEAACSDDATTFVRGEVQTGA